MLIAEKGETGYFAHQALCSYNKAVKQTAVEEGLRSIGKIDPAAIIKHLSYDGKLAARNAKRADNRRRPGWGSSGNLYACYRYNFTAEGCAGGCGYRHIFSSCGAQAHLAGDCPKKTGSSHGNRK